ncbi:hypothetical protein ACFSX5_02065 [Devosia albogilva]|uniref:Uncharacterized protein n=1 Tax=Devosia albogilva TaxID=429726 RepID=A0ABW5QG31_9HYPH
MVAAIAPAPVYAGNTSLTDMRHRPLRGERGTVPATTPPSDSEADLDQDAADSQQGQPHPDNSRSGPANFAAAVIAGALPPTAQSMDELIRRIGASEIPPESEARLKDILA